MNLTNRYTGYSGIEYILEYSDSDSFDHLDKTKCTQTYGVCFYDGKIVIVYQGYKKFWGLVGGTIEEGETFEQTLKREVREESNMEVLSFLPIGYQKCIDTRDDSFVYQLRYACTVKPYGPFVSDPAGTIAEIKLIDIKDYKQYFDWGSIGDRIMERALEILPKMQNERKLQDDTAEFLAKAISRHLNSGQHVLFFVTGGSGIEVGIKVSEILRNQPHENLTITLTDERYGPVGHADSNWQQLMEKGFSLPGARLIPVLSGDDALTTCKKFNQVLEEEIAKSSYKIGLFGIGADGHTAGILPESEAVNSPDLAYTYKTEKFERITSTPKLIVELNEAVVYAKGEEKWKTLEELQHDKDIHKQPAQILKVVPLLTMFTDYQK